MIALRLHFDLVKQICPDILALRAHIVQVSGRLLISRNRIENPLISGRDHHHRENRDRYLLTWNQKHTVRVFVEKVLLQIQVKIAEHLMPVHVVPVNQLVEVRKVPIAPGVQKQRSSKE